MEYIRDSKKTPRCRNCNNVVRPGVTLYGEQLDSHLTSLAATEVEKAEVLLLLGTKLSSDVYSNYVKFFEGEQIVVIHEKEHYTDCKADMADAKSCPSKPYVRHRKKKDTTFAGRRQCQKSGDKSKL